MSQTKANHGIFDSIVEEGESTSQPTPVPTVLFQPDGSTDQISVTDRGSTKGVSFVLDDKENTVDSENRIASKSLKSIRSAELHRLRASKKKSPMRRNLVKMTEAAIDDATTSLRNSALKPKKFSTNNASTFQSINAGRTAKTRAYQQKAKAVKSVSFQWDQDKAKSKSLQKVVEENRRQIRAIQRKLTSNHFKDKARRDEAKKMERLAALEKEYLFKSEVFQDHQKTLKFERDKSRKKSMDARAKIRINKLEGEEVMRMRKLEEDQAIFQTRENLHNARREAQKEEAERRRKSLQLRADIARKARDANSELRENEQHENRATHELNRAAAKDVDNYKKQLQKESQDDFKKRNKDAHDARNRQQNQACEAMLAEHESYELKWAGERDAEAYRKHMQEERRKSLAGRNKESARHAKVMEELRSIAKEEEAQTFMLKFQGENDAKDYIATMAENRRKSLELRGVEARRRREVEEEQHAKAVEASLIEGALKSDCQKDVENYKAECAERRRKSLQYRRKEARLQRLEAEERRLDQLQKDEESANLGSLAQKDVENYYKDCRKQRRKSLALRAKESRQHIEWKKRRAREEQQERALTGHLKSLDIHHMALAQERERAQKAMDALRNAGYHWKGNPFGDLLNDL